mmetsp:Transcript_20559/g.50449  ORF Transcript_20559/g.50449 Transcript_20559/m.50449 type:complete len:89 (+) Transcript_20559:923-1189(+)
MESTFLSSGGSIRLTPAYDNSPFTLSSLLNCNLSRLADVTVALIQYSPSLNSIRSPSTGLLDSDIDDEASISNSLQRCVNDGVSVDLA